MINYIYLTNCKQREKSTYWPALSTDRRHQTQARGSVPQSKYSEKSPNWGKTFAPSTERSRIIEAYWKVKLLQNVSKSTVSVKIIQQKHIHQKQLVENVLSKLLCWYWGKADFLFFNCIRTKKLLCPLTVLLRSRWTLNNEHGINFGLNIAFLLNNLFFLPDVSVFYIAERISC